MLQSGPPLIQLRPRADCIYISRDRTVLVTDLAGTVRGGEHGLWVLETRMLSAHEWRIRGQRPMPAGASTIAADQWSGYAIISAFPDDPDKDNPTQYPIELRLLRAVGDGMREQVELINHTQEEITIELAARLDADFAALPEATGPRKQHGLVTTTWHPDRARGELVFDYRAEHGAARLHRSLSVTVTHADSAPRRSDEGIAFRAALSPHRVWRAEILFAAYEEGRPLATPTRRVSAGPPQTCIEASDCGGLAATAVAAFERARADLDALRLSDHDRNERRWTVVAGAPTYMAFFGRDSLVASLEAAMLGPEWLEGALDELAATQAMSRDDWRDAQPGRMLHERHTDPLAALLYEPHGLYYGDATASLLFPVALGSLFQWTGNDALVRRYIEHAERAVAWADRTLRGADGFYRYRSYSSQGEKNQGWKDSGDAIVWPDGRQVDDPLGTCEMQGFAYLAKRTLASLLRRFGRRAEARRHFTDARELKERFNDTFWMDDEGFVALAIDGRGALVRTIASDAAHCLTTSILARERAPRVVARLFQKELFSGWGIRTLSSDHPAYCPFAYHRGTVWPVENAAIALGLARGGFFREMHAVCRAQLEAAALFAHTRLPEVFAGHARDGSHPFPGLYPPADWPQAWSASAVVAMIHAMLGLTPDASRRRLHVDPHLPEWLPTLALRGLRVGTAAVNIRFQRERDGTTSYDAAAVHGEVEIVRSAKRAKGANGARDANSQARPL